MITFHHFKSGEIIIKENDFGESAYLIKEGRVRVTKEVNGQDIHICELGFGSIFGEMSMIDDKPRSATVTAIEDTVVKQMHHDNLLLGLQQGQELAVKILKILFERLRKANATISRLKSEKPKPNEVFDSPESQFVQTAKTVILLEGLTRSAVKTLPKNPFQIKMFPFLIGRKSKDPLTNNDLMIKDKQPYQISRHHIVLDKHENEVFVSDRGSHLGTIVDRKQLGGSSENRGPMKVKSTESTVVLGNKHSPYKYKVICKL
jgi:CRP/FNR family cyclic AMP-dependent transcriptional regulator